VLNDLSIKLVQNFKYEGAQTETFPPPPQINKSWVTLPRTGLSPIKIIYLSFNIYGVNQINDFNLCQINMSKDTRFLLIGNVIDILI